MNVPHLGWFGNYMVARAGPSLPTFKLYRNCIVAPQGELMSHAMIEHFEVVEGMFLLGTFTLSGLVGMCPAL